MKPINHLADKHYQESIRNHIRVLQNELDERAYPRVTADELHDVLKNHVGIGAQTVALNKIIRAK